jgi:site-specific DNA recombinase
MRAAIYCRVSTDEQAKDGSSLDAQKDNSDRKVLEWNYIHAGHYIDDGYSAKDMKRPALQKLLEDAEKRLFDVVVYYRLDRLTRNSKDFHKLVERLDKHNVGIKSVTEPIDTTTAIGRFQLELSVSLAQLERETISERVFFVMEERIRKGIRNGGPPTFGYRKNKDTGEFIVVEPEAAIVKRIFDMYSLGTGMKTIAITLNQEGIKGSKTSLWSSPTIKHMLENPFYIGKLRWNYIDKNHKRTNKEIIVDATHEPIIEQVLFDRVQNDIARRKKGGKKFTSNFIFSSVLKCGKCGSTMNGFSYEKKGVRYKTYRCGGRYDRGMCDFHNTRERSVADAFLAAINVPEKDLEQYLSIQEPTDDEKVRVESIEQELTNISKRSKKWHYAYANEAITLEQLKEYTTEDKLREEFLKKQLTSIQPVTKSNLSKHEIIEMIKQLREYWDQLTDQAKKLFIQEAFESITIMTSEGSKTGPGVRVKVDAKLVFRLR